MRNRLTFVVAVMSLIGAGALAAPAAPAGRVSVAVAFSPRVETKLRERFGPKEADVLRDAVTRAVGDSLAQPTAAGAAARALAVDVEITDLEPTHPTRAQSAESPGLDPHLSRSLGGAAMTGIVHDADGTVLARLAVSRFAPDLSQISASGDAWADARLAIQLFASKLARKVAAQR